MKFRIVSDLHLEFYDKFRLPILPDDKESVLILAGDICVVNNVKQFKAFFKDVSDRFRQVFYIFGNHEYYRGSVDRAVEKFKENIKHDNLFVTDCGSLTIDEFHLIGATLWTDMNKSNPLDMWNAQRMMNDFSLIRCGKPEAPYLLKFKPLKSVELHYFHKDFIEKELENNKDKKCIVISHHLPCKLSADEHFKDSDLNSAYYSELSEFIFKHQPKLWCHGHTHASCEYNLDQTKVICNPKGYAQYIDPITKIEKFQNKSFDPELVIEL